MPERMMTAQEWLLLATYKSDLSEDDESRAYGMGQELAAKVRARFGNPPDKEAERP